MDVELVMSNLLAIQHGDNDKNLENYVNTLSFRLSYSPVLTAINPVFSDSNVLW